MKLDYLREFLVLSQELNYSSASARLYISQSTLSRHISILETQLGGKLLERSTHSVELTPLGKKTSLKFRDILDEYDSLFSEGHTGVHQLSGELSLGLLYYGVAEYYSDFLEQFAEKYPGIRLSVHNFHPHHLFRELTNGNLDAGDMFYARGLLRDVKYTRNIENVPCAILKCNGVHLTGERVRRQGFPNIRYIPVIDKEAFSYHCFVHRNDNTNKLLPVFINEADTYFKNQSGEA